MNKTQAITNYKTHKPQLPTAVNPAPFNPEGGLEDPSLYFNRELSHLDFNWRVYFQAEDERHPLLERIRFMGITASNLDEFIQKRLGGLKRQKAAGVQRLTPDGRNPAEQIELVQNNSFLMLDKMTRLWENDIKPTLKEQAGIVVSNYSELTSEQQEELDAYFMDHIYSILTPLAVDPGHPFPFISNLSLSLAILLKDPRRGVRQFARVKIPSNQNRLIPVTDKDHPYHLVPLEQIIQHNIDKLFRGMDIIGAYPFRVTRNADVRRAEEEADDLISMISEELRERHFAPVVRMEIDHTMHEDVLKLLMRELGLEKMDVHKIHGTLDLTSCFEIAEIDIPEHRYEPWVPVIPPRLYHEGDTDEEQNIFDIIKRGDLLVHHPYESFTASVQRLIEEAANDPDVIAIKQTLYRTSDESPVVKALTRAAEKGKQVAVLVEVKARFDEANNIEWGKMLENAGVHVTYGLVGLKTHAKVALVIRREETGPKAYCHIGTGNYHVKTAGMYTDLGLLTGDPVIGNDVINLFHYLTGIAPDQHYKKLMVAPVDMRDSFRELIQNEIDAARQDKPAHIIAKMNAIDDLETVKLLYEASRAGVSIDLIVRGHCRLRPGLEGISENIHVCSIIGRFLEHGRIYYFKNSKKFKVYIGSADWRNRNLSERVEAVVPITDKKLEKEVRGILKLALKDNRLAWDLHSDGTYTQRHPGEGEEGINFHEVLMKRAMEKAEQ